MVKVLPRVKDLRCGGCSRLLAKVGQFDVLQIKCPRCRAINNLRAESLRTAPSNDGQEPLCTPSPSSPG
ncbi:Com family DNA-binding transcriptional regulator [Pseudomonas peli]|uniref:Com family DNA-binding transcriptional regulator n=1 Tax=Pseudomonas peli TaxID=592361 RepID=UPI00286BB8EB|nr:Com family DNA-binding transcriptional regulator [Pseudomonas peli]